MSPADGEPWFAELPASVPLGALRYVRYDELELEFEPGSTLALYTDGLVERAGESLDTGLERLATTVSADYRHSHPPGEVARRGALSGRG